MTDAELHSLRRLARRHGVIPRHLDGFARYCEVPPEALIAVLRELGSPVESVRDVPGALRQRRHEIWQLFVDPVVVVWDSEPHARCLLRVPEGGSDALVRCELQFADGETQTWTQDLADLRTCRRVEFDARAYRACFLPLPDGLPFGYHRLFLEWNGSRSETTLICAPRLCYAPAASEAKRNWGVFLPLYALQTETSWGAGDLGDLEVLTDWAHNQGGAAVGTLPLLTAFLDFPFDPSPYGPASRLFWNEFYIDVPRAPEFAICPQARHAVHSDAWKAEIEELRRAPLADVRRVMALKRRVLEELSRALVRHPSGRRDEFDLYVESRPVLNKYAQFRATVEKRRQTWREWPETGKSGFLHGADFDDDARNYHLYVQWLADHQLSTLAQKTRGGGTGLYLDLPLGVHPDGFDVWDEPESFALGVAGGAPPDRFFTKGQNWGFSPLNPANVRGTGHRHWLACLRHHMQHAGVLRIDHVMGLHRLYWIPHGMEASAGAYVQYPAAELYAVLSLESHRHQTVIVGEDLGTVPGYIRHSMQEHALRGMYVAQFESNPNPNEALRPAPARSFASMNTHDTATFASFWDAADIDDQIDLGLLRADEAENDRRYRESVRDALVQYLRGRGHLPENQSDAAAVLRGCLLEMAAGPAEFLLVTLEDLWGERLPQNTPGTVNERPNWRRKAAHSFEEFRRMPEVVEILERINKLRSQ
ncbi:MAG: 4-alpha-glucanotransferase [Bryobacterales bacterium]